MAISTLASAITGMQYPRYISKQVSASMTAGIPFSFWAIGGSPAAGAFDNTLNGVTLSGTSNQVAGQIGYTDPNSGNGYLGRLEMRCATKGTLILADRLWHNGGYTITSTSAQNSTTPTWPARDTAGATSGDGVLLGLEISSATGIATPTITATYTNSGATGSRTGTSIIATGNSAAAGSFFPIGLQAGDTGVQSVQSIQLSTSWLSGTMNLVAYREIARLEMKIPQTVYSLDAFTGGMPQMYNGSVPFLIFIANVDISATTSLQGQVNYTWG